MLSKLAEELLTKTQPEAVDTPINRIVLAVDGSAPAVEATKYAMGFAKRSSSEIIAIFVDPDGEDAIIPDHEWELLAKKTKRIRCGLAGLKLARKYGKANCINVKLLLLRGNPVKQIINIAEKEGADLIVTGNTGLTGIKKIALGSIAEAVVEASDVPVLVVKRRKMY
ncbi:MAG: universal stress protein [Desulfotomaculum sp.]|nr:universal stress protein [Desulfotomaculum sp.]